MSTTTTLTTEQREDRAKRVAAAWGYRIIRDGDLWCVFNAGNDNPDPMWALGASSELDSAVSWVLDGCDDEAKRLAWEYLAGGGSDDDWKPFTA